MVSFSSIISSASLRFYLLSVKLSSIMPLEIYSLTRL